MHIDARSRRSTRVLYSVLPCVPPYRLQTQEARSEAGEAMLMFMAELLQQASAATRQLAVDLIDTTLATAGREFRSGPRTTAEVRVYADAVADMFCAYLRQLGAHRRAPPAYTA